MKQKSPFLVIAVLLAASFCAPLETALAFDTSRDSYINGGYYNSLVPDGDFIDINSMSAGDVQNFLNSKGGHLASAPSGELGDRANGRSAAQIIYDAAHGSGEASGTLNGIVINGQTGSISPRSILVTLQKESSLVTRTEYNQTLLDQAMGYGCPDSGGCNDKYKGFTNQIEWAAWQLRYNYEAAGKDASWWNSHYGGQSAYYKGYSRSHNWSGGDNYVVTYQNQSTASLYRYTPHVGYGNYNFWQLMINWFGVSPIQLNGTTLAINDTETVIQATYRGSIKIAGTKDTESKVYYNGEQIAGTGGSTWSTTITLELGNHDYYIIYKDSNGTNQIAQKKLSIDRRTQGDVNGDVKVDLLDVSLMSTAWGLTVKDDAWLNLNPDNDNIVDLLDLSLLANNFGR